MAKIDDKWARIFKKIQLILENNQKLEERNHTLQLQIQGLENKIIELNKEKINLLQKELEKCVKDQNFERAIEIRDQLKRADITVK